MKTFGRLYAEIISLENLYRAAGKARKRKSRKEDVERFELHRERNLRRLHEELAAETWRPSRYARFSIYEPKVRLISAAPFRDRVVHHALCNVIAPLIERRFVYDSYSCRKGKGTEAGRERCRRYTNRYAYALKGDIRKYFESIDHAVLKERLARVIRCKPTRRLCAKIIDSSSTDRGVVPWMADDDLFTTAARNRGLPIGNLTSQLWANLYLDRLDHVIREELKPAGYVRYTDDFILWAEDKAFLHSCRQVIARELEQERLLLHPSKTRVFPCRVGVPFLGFQFFPQRVPRLLGTCKRRFERRGRRALRRTDKETRRASVAGWKAFADYGNTVGLYEKYRQDGFGWPGDMDEVGFGAWRGASWNNNNQDNLRCSNRNDNNASNRNNNNGFRLVLVSPERVADNGREHK